MKLYIVAGCALIAGCTPAWDPASPMHWASTGNAALDLSLALILTLLISRGAR